MQPLYSVDHESRHNSNHAEVDSEAPQPAESTPLLQRFPQNHHPGNPFTGVIVSLLLVILITGVIIGIYLLVLQNEAENIIHEGEPALELVSRVQWDHRNISEATQEPKSYGLKQVMVVQTDTNQCFSTETCTKLLQAMQANVTTKSSIPYNFLISSNGQVYEALGWQRSAPVSTQPLSNGLVLAFIGNFSRVAPTRPQMQAAKDFFTESVSQQYLHPSYRIIGKNVHDTPLYLTESLKDLPQWSNDVVDLN